jgi:hypothetical protein
MPTTPPNCPVPLRHAVILNATERLSGTIARRARRFALDCALVGLADCGRLIRDIVIGVLCGATVGAFYAMVDSSL